LQQARRGCLGGGCPSQSQAASTQLCRAATWPWLAAQQLWEPRLAAAAGQLQASPAVVPRRLLPQLRAAHRLPACTRVLPLRLPLLPPLQALRLLLLLLLQRRATPRPLALPAPQGPCRQLVVLPLAGSSGRSRPSTLRRCSATPPQT
jgi:hypothetical protein